MDIDNLILLPITTKAVCFCRMLNVFEASKANNVDPEQTVARDGVLVLILVLVLT